MTSELVISLVLFFLYLFVNVTFSFHPFLVPLLLYFLFAITFFFFSPQLSSSAFLFLYSPFACFDPSLAVNSKKR